MAALTIERLGVEHAPAILDCFARVYGGSYANELFYDVDALAEELRTGRLSSVGALDGDGRVLGHMAMVCHPGALFAELGNTVVDPEARGSGVAWQVGGELTDWCVEKGYTAYLHYPTTDHHIMQRQSVKKGFETGLMLGYIPAETDGQVNADKPSLRGASTVVVNPLAPCDAQAVHSPGRYADLLRELVRTSGLPRNLSNVSSGPLPSATEHVIATFPKRQLARLEVSGVGQDLGDVLQRFLDQSLPCLHLDFSLADGGVDAGVEVARRAGFVFCAWLPGYRSADVVRLQRVDVTVTDVRPAVVNSTGKRLRALIERELEEVRE